MTLPLLFTNSGKEIYIVAPRCYFLQYFMLVIYIYRTLADKNKIGTKKTKRITAISFASLLLITVAIYCRLDYMGIVRDNTVNEALNKDYSSVEVIEYPKSIEHIQWSGNFIEKQLYLERYRLFKGIPMIKK